MKLKKKNFRIHQLQGKRTSLVKKDKILAHIYNLHGRYLQKEISIQEYLSKISCLTADLLSSHFKFEMPRELQDRTIMMIANYYIMLHMDMYTGFYTIDRNYIYEQETRLSDEVFNKTGLEGAGYLLYKKNENELIRVRSHEYIKEQLEVYYNKGTEGCLKQLARSIYALISKLDDNHARSEDKIEEVIQSVQIGKILNPDSNHY